MILCVVWVVLFVVGCVYGLLWRIYEDFVLVCVCCVGGVFVDCGWVCGFVGVCGICVSWCVV